MTATAERGVGSTHSPEDRYRETGRTVYPTGLQAQVRVPDLRTVLNPLFSRTACLKC